MLVGAHESVAGGLDRAFQFAQEDGCAALQIFTKNSNQWRDPVLTEQQCQAFKQARAASPLASTPLLSHDSYLINLCTGDEDLRSRSRDSLLAEVRRCAALGIEYVVLHPGAHLGAGVQDGIDAAAEMLAWVLQQSIDSSVALLLENTAGQGSAIGSRFEEIAGILRGVKQDSGGQAASRLGVCLDTCHAFAAGYDLSSEQSFDHCWAEFDRVIGLQQLKALHLNDSKKGLGSRVDRHERLGLGELGLYPFWRLLNDSSLAKVVGVLETPPVEKDRAYKDQLALLRGLQGAPAPGKKAFKLEAEDTAEKPKPRGSAKAKRKS